jgi:hypothetical protein
VRFGAIVSIFDRQPLRKNDILMLVLLTVELWAARWRCPSDPQHPSGIRYGTSEGAACQVGLYEETSVGAAAFPQPTLRKWRRRYRTEGEVCLAGIVSFLSSAH